MRAAGLFGLSVMVLAGCEEGTGTGQKSFQKQYAVAREALEEGRYVRASEAYATLIPRAGPLAPRLKLEYAHAQLRAGHFDKAAQQAAALAGSQDGAARSAALAVEGTARHEMGLAALDAGDRSAARQHLTAAQSALGKMLKSHPDLDPLGAMAGRQAAIRVQLKSI